MTEQEAYTLPESVDAAIEKAAEHLPEGWVVNISVERHGYGVSLSKPDGSEVSNVDGGDGIRSDIDAAIRIACGFDE
jgi:hypothetical protein